MGMERPLVSPVAHSCPDVTDLAVRVTKLENAHVETTDKLNGIISRLKTVEVIGSDVTSIMALVEKISKRLKFWAPSIVGAAISAGIVNGKLGAFLHALFNGGN